MRISTFAAMSLGSFPAPLLAVHVFGWAWAGSRTQSQLGKRYGLWQCFFFKYRCLLCSSVLWLFPQGHIFDSTTFFCERVYVWWKHLKFFKVPFLMYWCSLCKLARTAFKKPDCALFSLSLSFSPCLPPKNASFYPLWILETQVQIHFHCTVVLFLFCFCSYLTWAVN